MTSVKKNNQSKNIFLNTPFHNHNNNNDIYKPISLHQLATQIRGGSEQPCASEGDTSPIRKVMLTSCRVLFVYGKRSSE